MKYIKRILVVLPVFIILLVTHMFFVFKRSFEFLKYGGELIQYSKNDAETIHRLYWELIKQNEDRDRHRGDW